MKGHQTKNHTRLSNFDRECLSEITLNLEVVKGEISILAFPAILFSQGEKFVKL